MEGWCLHEGLPFYLSDPGSLQEQSYSNGEGLGKKVPCGGQNENHICPFLSSCFFSF